MEFRYPEPDAAEIARAARILSQGGLVAVPTETVYGLAADADDREAVLATFAAKNRPTWHPLIVHVYGPEDIGAWTTDAPETAYALARAFWPGPLTLVLPKSGRCGDFVTGGQDSVALRCPAHPWARELLRQFRGAEHKGFTAPSCNTFGHISPTTAAHVAEDLGVKPEGKLDMILDGGPCPVGVESTILSLVGGEPRLLRHGAVTREMLEDFLGCPVPDGNKESPRVSGTLKSHYAPDTRAETVPGGELAARARFLAPTAVAVLAREAVLRELPDNAVLAIPAHEDEALYARDLYENLHRLDRAGAGRILIETPPADAAWAAVNDRLARACAEKDSKF